MISVVEDQTIIELGRGIVVLESDLPGQKGIAELQNSETIRFAMKTAQLRGLPDPRLSNTVPHPYAIDKEGELVKLGSPQVVSRFRIDIPVTGPLL